MVTEIGETFTWGQWGLSANFTMVYTAHWTGSQGYIEAFIQCLSPGQERQYFVGMLLLLFLPLSSVSAHGNMVSSARVLGLPLVSRLLLLLGGTVGVKLVSNQARAVPQGWNTPLLTTPRRLDSAACGTPTSPTFQVSQLSPQSCAHSQKLRPGQNNTLHATPGWPLDLLLYSVPVEQLVVEI